MREFVAERIEHETEEESNARKEQMRMRMKQRLRQETEAKRNRMRKAQNSVHRVNSPLFTEASYQQLINIG